MNLRRYQDIVAFRGPTGQVMGFNTQNLEIATLDEEAWEAMNASDQWETTAHLELKRWSQETGPLASQTNPTTHTIREFSLNLAQVCDLRCTYCGADGDGTYGSGKARADLDIVEKQLRFFITRLSRGDVFRLQFVGGEPLLYADEMKKIAQRATELASAQGVEIQFSLVTNGTRVSTAVADFLAEQNYQVTLSLDGDPKVQDRLRPTRKGGASSPEVLRGLKELLRVRQGLRSLHVNAVMGSHHLDILGTYSYLRQFDFDLYNFGFAAGDDDHKASPIYLREMAVLAERVFRADGINGLARIQPFGRFLRALDSGHPVENFCGAGKSFIHADTSGGLYACNWFSGDEKEKLGQGDRLDESKRQEWSEALTARHDCQTCWAKNLCGGGCASVFRTKTGQTNLRDHYFCDRIRGLAALSVQYLAMELTKSQQSRGSYEAHKEVKRQVW
ncbi:MAG: radical SAM protein [Bdellovibrionaceae bacterium]|nr:radical SAM protein [Bdellovibrionales bacterium]MCB9086492.1 radical SAM protein [Pseudobdellovibrionaceae bacterium]